MTRFGAFLAFATLCILGGGASRPDVLSLIYLRPVAIIVAAALLLMPGDIDWRRVRDPLLLLGALALSIGVQLIPLPPAIWSQLPGHGPLLEAATAAGIPQPWRPISLVPQLTLNSLVALVIPAATLISLASLTREQIRLLLPCLVGALFLTALVGLVQLIGTHRGLYLYRITNNGAAVGLFANRNHQAVLLAIALPCITAWAVQPTDNEPYRKARFWMATAMGLFMLPMILATGSRAGLVIGLLAMLISLLFVKRLTKRRRSRSRPLSRLIQVAPWVVGALAIGAAISMSRATALNRLLAATSYGERRATVLPEILGIVADFMPLGSGYGTFDPVYRWYEPDRLLSVEYLNHAHNDLLELAMTGGLPAVLVLAAFLIWWVSATITVGRVVRRHYLPQLLALLGSVIIGLLLVASLVDYPLRTPAIEMVFAVGCCWLTGGWVAARQTEADADTDGAAAVGLYEDRNRV